MPVIRKIKDIIMGNKNPVDAIIFTDINGVPGFARYAGAYKVATELRKAGFTVQVVDFFAELNLELAQRLIDLYVSEKTLFVGFSTTLFKRKTSQKEIVKQRRVNALDSRKQHLRAYFPHDDEYVEELIRLLKIKNPKIKVVLGGAKAYDYDMNYPGVDYWLAGEADVSIVELAKHLQDKSHKLKGYPVKTGFRVDGENLYPYDDFKTSQIVYDKSDHVFPGEHLPLELSRGCIFSCSFCNRPKVQDGTNYKEVEVIRDELIRNYEEFGTTGYLFTEDLFNDSIKKVEYFHKLFTSLPFKIEWSSYARIDMIWRYPEMRELLLESGAKSLSFGIETFNHKSAKAIKKGLHPDKVKETLYFLKEKWNNNVLIAGSFIVGLPYETEETMAKTLEWLSRADCPIDTYSLQVLIIKKFREDNVGVVDFADLAKEPEKHGYVRTNYGWKGHDMDSRQAEKIISDYANSDQYLKRRKMANYSFYNRLRNLNYSFDECYHFVESEEIKVEMLKRYNLLRDSYFKKLLKL